MIEKEDLLEAMKQRIAEIEDDREHIKERCALEVEDYKERIKNLANVLEQVKTRCKELEGQHDKDKDYYEKIIRDINIANAKEKVKAEERIRDLEGTVRVLAQMV